MKTRVLCVALFAMVLMFVGGCGGGSGGSSDGGSGTLSVNVTDTKPLIAGEPTEVWLTFEEVRAHKSGGGWVSLPLPQTPFEINLMAFQGEATTHLVPPVRLDSGHYTQLRFEVSRAYMVIGGSAVEIDLDVPSGFLRIDKEFTFDVPDGEAVDLTVDFDLSQSIVMSGSLPPEYKLKPVLHLVHTQQAATIQGSIAEGTFPASGEAVVTVIWDKKLAEEGTDVDEEYTKVRVEKTTDPTPFQIFWLVPNEDYIVKVEIDDDGDENTPPNLVHEEAVLSGQLEVDDPPFDLNDGDPI